MIVGQVVGIYNQKHVICKSSGIDVDETEEWKRINLVTNPDGICSAYDIE